MVEIQNVYSVGIEFEFSSSIQDKMRDDRRFTELGFKVVHDASSETPGRALNDLLLDSESSISIPGEHEVKLGGELVTNIWFNGEPTDVYEKLKTFSRILHGYGEPQRAERAGIHYHVSFPNNLNAMKSSLMLGTHLENVFFTLGGMGYMNRGTLNDATYFRPITRDGPLVVPLANGKFAQCFSIEDLLEARSSKEFFHMYGDIKYVSSSRGRYIPIRYHWLNLSNLALRKETLEFRVFNITLNPLYIWACLQFCTAFSDFCIDHSPDELREMGFGEENSVYANQGKDTILKTAENFMNNVDIDNKVKYVILEIIDRSPEATIESGLVYCHLVSKNLICYHWESSTYEPKRLITSEIRHPKYVDYHNYAGGN